MPDVLTVEHLHSRHVAEDIEPGDLVEVIDGEESYLKARLRSPLTGDWTQTFHGGGFGSLWLSRPMTDLVVTDAGVLVDPSLYAVDDNRVIGLAGSLYWMGPVTVAGTLADTDLVRTTLVDLVRLRLGDTGNESESSGGSSRTNTLTAEQRRGEILRALLPTRGI